MLSPIEDLLDEAPPLDHPSNAHGALPHDHFATEEVEMSSKEDYHSEAGVDVKKAELEFAKLNRKISNISQMSKSLTRSKSHRSTFSESKSFVKESDFEKDVEKGLPSESDESDQFDLESTLRNSKAIEDETGIKNKHIGVLWENLSVSGLGGVKSYVKTFPQAFVSFFNVFETAAHIFGFGKRGREVTILDNFHGVVKPGEMVLVLGRPGSGCTTFLKVISNQRYGFTKIGGNVQYGPFDSKTFSERYRGEAVYNMEDDVHLPTLSVEQTLGFALDVKTPGKRPGGMSAAEFKSKIVTLLLRMFNIEHTRTTMVGNQHVRGVSGGERKRVSIAEMMISGAPICAWDNTSRGLDASTASDYARSLRVITNIYQTTTFVSLYQASSSIYSQFDKVLVIDEGRQVYFGPATEARAYFEGLGFAEKPRQTTPDYLTGCTDPFEREYQPGRNEGNAPSTAEDLEKAFKESKHSTALDQEVTAYKRSLEVETKIFEEFQQAVLEGKRHAPNKSVYTIPFHLQVWVLMRRQFFLKWQDKFMLTVSWVTSITIAIVLGTLWLNLPKTSAGAFTRGGVLFISLLFNAFQAFSELGSTLLGRPLQNKHRAYAFHQPSAQWIAQLGVDLAFASVQITIFSIIVYFMTGLVRTPGAFFTFTLIILCGYLAQTVFFRTIGCLCPDFDYAIRIAGIVLTLLVMTSGYLIQQQLGQVWLTWIFYINPLGLGFAALMMNEFERIGLTCTSESLVPPYGDLEHQVCTLKGSVAGQPVVQGTNYIEAAFSYDPSDLWRNFGIILVLIATYLGTNVILGENIRWNAGGKTITFFAKENEELKRLNSELQEKKQRRLRKEGGETASDLRIHSEAVLTWEDLCYDVPVQSGHRRLLNNVFGYVKPGQLTALMGASGAGKTTLLDVLASRKNIGVIGGSVLVDGMAPGTAFQRSTSYAEQLDVHENTQTVREALRFSAELRQPFEVPQSEKYAYVEEVIGLLEMEDIADAIIGNPDSGLAVEQRKRVTIGVELAAKPELLLFLDEPTSGLDSQSAFNIVRFLRKLAAANQAILCTIHQPNSALFENFDRLLLLQKGGECVYFGDIGADAGIMLEYFARNGAHCPADANPAEFILDAVGAGQAPRIGDSDWADIWRESDELATVKQEIVRLKTERLHAVGSQEAIIQKEYATPLWHQIKIVNKRTQLSFWRSPNYGFTRLFNHVALALVAGLAFLQLDNSLTSLQYRVFVIFFVTVLPSLILAQVEPKYDLSRLIFYRESAAKAYSQLPFALSMVLAEIPYSILCAVGFYLPIYYITGFNPDPSRAGYQFFMVLICEMFAVTLGQTIAAITPSSFISALVNPFVIIVFSFFCGVTIPRPEMPKFWQAWLYQLDPFTRLIGGMVVTELHGLPVECTAAELNRFTSPASQTCGQYMAPFFANGGTGYLVSNQTQNCEYCHYNIGDQFYEPLKYAFDDRWRDLGIFAAFIASNLVLLFLASRYLNYNRR